MISPIARSKYRSAAIHSIRAHDPGGTPAGRSQERPDLGACLLNCNRGVPPYPSPLFLQSIHSKLVSKSTFAKYSFAMAYRQSLERMGLNAEIRGFRSQRIRKEEIERA